MKSWLSQEIPPLSLAQTNIFAKQYSKHDPLGQKSEGDYLILIINSVLLVKLIKQCLQIGICGIFKLFEA